MAYVGFPMSPRNDRRAARPRTLQTSALLAVILATSACQKPEAADAPASAATPDTASAQRESQTRPASSLPAGEVVYVSNEDSNDLTVISAVDNQVIETI